MASVEEVCDHITLINKSRNILSGSVEEIRRSAGGNNFEVVHRGSDDELRAALGDRAVMVGESRGAVGGYRETKIYVPKDEDLKATIASLNDSCGLRSLTEVMPSMNDIFIRAVNGTL
jgi:ABC-2 type transport system ATP-binding protein